MKAKSGAASAFSGGWTLSLIAIVVAVNAMSAWEIAATLRALGDHEEQTLRLETEAYARAVESRLASTTADLAFLTAAAPLALERADADALGAALLLFLHGNAQVAGLVVQDGLGSPLVEAGRPRGVPGYWIPGDRPSEFARDGGAPGRGFEIAARSGRAAGPARLAARLDPRALLPDSGAGAVPAGVACALDDAGGRPLARGSRWEEQPGRPVAEAQVAATGWSEAAPWRLRCARHAAAPAAALEPLVLRHRTSVAFNLVVMLFAALLGIVALYQSRRRRQSEEQASEQVRIRELERQLFHAERLSTVGRLAAGIAHEINNPLEGMANYLRLAEEAIDRGEGAVARQRIDGVRQGLDRAAGVVRRVLCHAEPEDALREDLDVAAVLMSAVEFVRSRDEFASIRFKAELPGRPEIVRGNGAMLSQVFLNLLLNACEAQPEGGEITVRCCRRGTWVECDVADRGPGVPASRRTRIFEPFETTKRSTGLGLSVCHAIVRRHEGELDVHEREGGGAVFRVRLRARQGEEGADAAV